MADSALAYNELYSFAIGPLFIAVICLSVAGLLIKIHQFIKFTVKIPRSIVTSVHQKQPITDRNNPPDQFVKLLVVLKGMILGEHTALTIVSTVFHICLLLVPLLVSAHHILLRQRLGFSMHPFVLSETFSNVLNWVFLICFFVLIMRRILVAHVRAITTKRDIFVLAMTALPFISGMLAASQIFFYKWMLLIHVLSGQLVIAAIPFTRLSHMLFFIFGRFTVCTEHSFGPGTRRWLPFYNERARVDG